MFTPDLLSFAIAASRAAASPFSVTISVPSGASLTISILPWMMLQSTPNSREICEISGCDALSASYFSEIITSSSPSFVRACPSSISSSMRWLADEPAMKLRVTSATGRVKSSTMSPSSTMCPSSMTAARPQISLTTAISCVMSTTVRFSLRLMSRISCRMLRVVCGSRALVASSQSSTLGSLANARAMATRCFCPPES